MLRFMRHVAAKVSTNNDMPSWVVFLVKFFFDVGSDILYGEGELRGDLLMLKRGVKSNGRSIFKASRETPTVAPRDGEIDFQRARVIDPPPRNR
mmetsp:Transcript_20771/g.60424  ORF Transcript_20771/g.60424 Transcript_20771/m.60424 type:complete len:94 (+) Transcript_20771:1639-1920(+)